MPPNVNALYSDRHVIREELKLADLVVGAVLYPRQSAAINFARRLKLMKPGSVIVDVAVDQGGCVETTRPTLIVIQSLSNRKWCIMCHQYAGAVGRTSTLACAMLPCLGF